MPGLNETLHKLNDIWRVDLLVSLQDIWGADIIKDRETLYKLVSGNCNDAELQDLLCSYYQDNDAFANYCDEAWIFGNKEQTLLFRIIQPARMRIFEYQSQVLQVLRNARCVLRGLDKDYVYYQQTTKSPWFEGREQVC